MTGRGFTGPFFDITRTDIDFGTVNRAHALTASSRCAKYHGGCQREPVNHLRDLACDKPFEYRLAEDVFSDIGMTTNRFLTLLET